MSASFHNPSFRKRAYFAKQNVSPLSGIQLFSHQTPIAKTGFHVAGKPFASRAAKGKALAWNDGALGDGSKNNYISDSTARNFA